MSFANILAEGPIVLWGAHVRHRGPESIAEYWGPQIYTLITVWTPLRSYEATVITRGGSTVGDAGDASPSTSNVCWFCQTTLMVQNKWFRQCNTPTWRW